VTKISSTRYSN